MYDDSRRLTREDLLELILKPFLDKSWNPCMGVVGMSEVKTMGIRDHGVERVLHVGQGLFHGIKGFLLFREKTMTAVGGVKHAEVNVICEVKEVLLIVEGGQ